MARKLGLAIAAILIAAVAAIFLFQTQIGSAMFKRAFERNSGRDTLATLDDGLHVGLCGTGSPMPNLDRAGPCNVVVAGDQVFLVDIGEGGARNVALMGINPAQVDALFLTHFHSDHIDGLGALQLMHWVRGASTVPLAVYGPSGVEAIVAGFNAAYATDDTYRTAHHGEEVAPTGGSGSEARPFEMSGDSTVVYDEGVKIIAFTVDHAPVSPAVGYRFDYKGRSLCISGDTKKSANLERVCKGVDILVHEALQPAMVSEMQSSFTRQANANAAKIMHDIQDYHASPADAAESAQVAGARMVVLSHLVPPLPGKFLHPAFLGNARSRFAGELIIGEDGMFFSLPADSEDVDQTMLM